MAFGNGTVFYPTHPDEGIRGGSYGQSNDGKAFIEPDYRVPKPDGPNPGVTLFSEKPPTADSGGVQTLPGYVSAFDKSAGLKPGDVKKSFHASSYANGEPGRGYFSATVKRKR